MWKGGKPASRGCHPARSLCSEVLTRLFLLKYVNYAFQLKLPEVMFHIYHHLKLLTSTFSMCLSRASAGQTHSGVSSPLPVPLSLSWT